MTITLGNVALYGICEINGGITKIHGQLRDSIKWSNGKTYPVFPIYHPSYILRGQGRKELDADIEKLKILIEKNND